MILFAIGPKQNFATSPCPSPYPQSEQSSTWAQYSVDLLGLYIHVLLKSLLFWDGRYLLLGFFCRLKSVSLGRDNGSFNSSNTDVVEKVHFLVAASQYRALRWRKDPLSTCTEMAFFWSLFTGGSFLVDFLKNEIVEFDNLEVVL